MKNQRENLSFRVLRGQFSDFYTKVAQIHSESTSQSRGGHGLDHDITVAALVTHITESPSLCKKAWCAAMLHSIDRLVHPSEVINVTKNCADYLKKYFDNKEVDEIVEAALRHGELNKDDQSETQKILMDADRLANMQLAVIIRSSQFRPNIPAFEFTFLQGQKNPLSTYENPKSILDDIRFIISNYVPQFRLKRAKELGSIYANRLQIYIDEIENDYKELDLLNLKL